MTTLERPRLRDRIKQATAALVGPSPEEELQRRRRQRQERAAKVTARREAETRRMGQRLPQANRTADTYHATLIAREAATRAALEQAKVAAIAAEQARKRAIANASGVLGGLLGAGSVQRAKADVERTTNLLQIARGDHEEAKAALNQYRRHLATIARGRVFADVRRRDERKAQERRAAGLPPLPKGEQVMVPDPRHVMRRGGAA